jgi:hypothetical protein
MACFFAIRSGLRDAKSANVPYFWGLLSEPEHRRYMIENGWKDIGRVFILAIAIDVVYQLIVLRFIYPGEAIIVAVILAIVPYLIVRGTVTRLAREKKNRAIRREENRRAGKAA